MLNQMSSLCSISCVLLFPDLVYLRAEDASKHTPSGRTPGRGFYFACFLFICGSCVNPASSGSRNLTREYIQLYPILFLPHAPHSRPDDCHVAKFGISDVLPSDARPYSLIARNDRGAMRYRYKQHEQTNLISA